jgi:hypothetical protein
MNDASTKNRERPAGQANSPAHPLPPSGVGDGTAFQVPWQSGISYGFFNILDCETPLDAAEEYCKVSPHQRLESQCSV